MWASLVAQLVMNPLANAGGARDHEFDPWVGKIPWRRKCQHTPVFLPGKSHGQRGMAGWGCKESDMTEHTCTHTHTHAYMYIFFYNKYL